MTAKADARRECTRTMVLSLQSPRRKGGGRRSGYKRRGGCGIGSRYVTVGINMACSDAPLIGSCMASKPSLPRADWLLARLPVVSRPNLEIFFCVSRPRISHRDWPTEGNRPFQGSLQTKNCIASIELGSTFYESDWRDLRCICRFGGPRRNGTGGKKSYCEGAPTRNRRRHNGGEEVEMATFHSSQNFGEIVDSIGF
jgi:hypothetical protein